MQVVNHIREAHSVDRAIRISIRVLDDFENARTLTLPRLGRGMLRADLRKTDAYPTAETTSRGKVIKSRFDEPI